jgi:hypothetical protein
MCVAVRMFVVIVIWLRERMAKLINQTVGGCAPTAQPDAFRKPPFPTVMRAG